jgi:hypothetical protein
VSSDKINPIITDEIIKLSSDKEIHIEVLKRVVNPLAVRFYAPVYLVGSFIEKGIDALDIDIIMVITSDRWMRIFRQKDWNERQFRFIKKQRDFLEQFLQGRDIDFKVQTYETFGKHNEARIRLDNPLERKDGE